MYLIVKLSFNKNCCLVLTEETQSFSGVIFVYFCWLATLEAWIPLKPVKCAIKWYMAATIWENIDKQSILFQRKTWKTWWSYYDHVWIMQNMVIIPWSCRESWWPCQETWLPCRHHGMIVTMFRHDYGMIMARSWHGSHVFPTRGRLLFRISIMVLGREGRVWEGVKSVRGGELTEKIQIIFSFREKLEIFSVNFSHSRSSKFNTPLPSPPPPPHAEANSSLIG